MLDIKYKENSITADDYIMLERKMGNPHSGLVTEQVNRSLSHTLYTVAAYKDNELIGMGRLLGDAAIYWLIEDVWVLPEYRGNGIGSSMVKSLIQYVKENSIAGTSVSIFLMCSKGKEGFYEKLGFLCRPHSWEGAGMEMELDI